MKKAIVSLLCLLLLGLCLFSGWKVVTILGEYRRIETEYEAITEAYVRAPEPELPAAGTLPPELIEREPAAGISVDFEALLADCADVVGWIYCPDTPINYPILRAEDNDYYLRRLLNGTYNIGGSIFMDYRCAADFSGWNTIIYGHTMRNQTMFGSLQNYKTQDYYEAHPTLWLLTPAGDHRIDLIGGYVTPATGGAYARPDTQEGRDLLISEAVQQSTFTADVTVADGERLITLSTCVYDYDDARFVLVGVLRPLEE